jgi:hypothetical protein
MVGVDLVDDLVGIIEGLHIEALFFQDDGTDLKNVQVIIQYQYSFVHIRVLVQISAINSMPANRKGKDWSLANE